MTEELKTVFRAAPISAALAREVCDPLPLAAADRSELLRYLGYPRDTAPAERLAGHIDEFVARAMRCLRPRGAYSVYPVAGHSEHSLELGGVTIFGNIGEYLAHAGRVAVFVVSVGEEISHRAEADAFSSWIMDAVGSWAAEASADALMQRLRLHLVEDEDLTLRYSPGYCGMDIRQQRNLFTLIDAESIGVALLPSLLMHPLKSISGLVGLAPKEAVARYHSPCDLCPRTGCHMRR